MNLTLYGLKSCDTCRKALKALPGATFVDIRQEADLGKKLPVWLEAAGADVLVNRRSTTWRTLSEAEQDQSAETLLTGHPTLIKRPIIEVDGTVHVGWSKAVQDALK
ncbi:MAG: ArsC/Spx/MgsR family protein [Pseudomonadota bacterium]